MSKNYLLQCKNLCKSYQDGSVHINVLRNVNFTMQTGEMIAIIGNSGSGKSTFLQLLGGLDSPNSGTVIFKGLSLNSISSSAKAKLRNRLIGFIYQFHHLLMDFTALENVAMPLLIGGTHTNLAKKKAMEILEEVGLQNRSNHRPSQLSGGEKQRVAIARSVVHNPALVLADEPTGNLDTGSAANIFDLLSKLNVCYGTGFLVATHDLYLSKRLDYQLEIIDGDLHTPSPLLKIQ